MSLMNLPSGQPLSGVTITISGHTRKCTLLDEAVNSITIDEPVPANVLARMSYSISVRAANAGGPRDSAWPWRCTVFRRILMTGIPSAYTLNFSTVYVRVRVCVCVCVCVTLEHANQGSLSQISNQMMRGRKEQQGARASFCPTRKQHTKRPTNSSRLPQS